MLLSLVSTLSFALKFDVISCTRSCLSLFPLLGYIALPHLQPDRETYTFLCLHLVLLIAARTA
jgi:hypothetical protein